MPVMNGICASKLLYQFLKDNKLRRTHITLHSAYLGD